MAKQQYESPKILIDDLGKFVRCDVIRVSGQMDGERSGDDFMYDPYNGN